MNLQISTDVSPCSSAVLLQNKLPILRSVSICADTVADDVYFTVSYKPAVLPEARYEIGKLVKGKTVKTECSCGVYTEQNLLTDNKKGTVQLTLNIYAKNGLIHSQSNTCRWMPDNTWFGSEQSPQALAALIMPNEEVVHELLRKAGDILKSKGLNAEWRGYGEECNAVINKMHAIWNTVAAMKMTHTPPPSSWQNTIQPVRSPLQLLQDKNADALETAALIAAMTAQAGLNPVIILTPGHAYVGTWLHDDVLPQPVVRQVSVIRNLMELGELHMLESSLCNPKHPGSPAPYSQAVQAAASAFGKLSDDADFLALDIVRIWTTGIQPIDPPSATEPTVTEPGVLPEQSYAPITPPPAELPQLPDVEDTDEYLPETSVAIMEEEDSLITARALTRMDVWQIKLLDLSLRNNLLNAKVDASQIRLCIPDVPAFEDKLSSGTAFRLKSLPEALGAEITDALRENTPDKVQAIHRRVAADMYKKHELLAVDSKKNITEALLLKRVQDLYRTGRRNMEEGGYNTLYIACGFLKWQRKGANKLRQDLYAPLVLIPAVLTRKTAKSGYELRGADEEARFNLTLAELLKTEYGITLPELEQELPKDSSGIDVQAVFSAVRKAIRGQAGWEVEEFCSLGIFSFAKYLMWKDMTDRSEDLMKNPIVSHIAAEERDKFPAQVGFPDSNTLDIATDLSTIFTPLSSDSSQLSAILAAGMGKNFVLIGPPGTGKSQTIANMIAHCLGHGKTVLFVAEKSAALSVVYNRLKRIGLGDFCLELHSNKANKKNVVAQFGASLEKAEKAQGITNWQFETERLADLRTTLAQHPRLLHAPLSDGTGLYNDIDILSKGSKVHTFTPCPQDPMSITPAQKQAMLDCAEQLSTHFTPVESLYPGVASTLQYRDYSFEWEESLTIALNTFKQAQDKYDAEVNALLSTLQLDEATYRPYCTQITELLSIAAETYGQDNTPLLPQTAVAELPRLKKMLEYANEYRRRRTALSISYPEDTVLDSPELQRLWGQWIVASASNFIVRFLEKRKIRKGMQIMAMSTQPPADCISDLEALVKMREARAYLNELRQEEPAKLQHFCKGVNMYLSDVQQAEQLAQRIALLSDIQDLCATYLSAEGNPMAPGSKLPRICANLHSAEDELRQAVAALCMPLGAPVADFCTKESGSGGKWASELLHLRKQWRMITFWNESAYQAVQNGHGEAATALEQHLVAPQELKQAMLYNFSRLRMAKAINTDEHLRKFYTPAHENTISRFREQDATVLKRAGEQLNYLLSSRAAQALNFAKEVSELKHEVNKQRAHKSPRKLLSLTPNVSTLLKPCMLMSPLSVAQYLAPDSKPFDVVIFDEASQIPVWDAIGAIARGTSAIIVGDPRQMPPTSFFTGNTKSDEGDEENITQQDLESILDECLACGIPQMNLTWHYRSRSESLIAFSNHNYYEDKLVTFPAPVAKDKALQYHYVKGTYERGARKRYNEIEAKALVEHVISVLKAPGFKYSNNTSIGIVTFNTQQQKLIEDLFEKARQADESLEEFFAEDTPDSIFVKNLENVQGDERGVIYFSTTYGPDENNFISMNFGPLNQTGGERRLNVAVTRARAGMHVFTSLQPEDINPLRTQARGAIDLRHFLECARSGADAYFNRTQRSGSMPNEGLIQAISSALTKAGHRCICNLGVSGFRVDIAVARKGDDENMIAGIMLDGKGYASAATVRDRDLLQESVLRGLGWNILRVWALDWWRDPEATLNKLLKQLDELSNSPELTSAKA